MEEISLYIVLYVVSDADCFQARRKDTYSSQVDEAANVTRINSGD
jgi:hypothetical protein